MSQVLPMLANWIVTVDNSYDSTALSSIETIVDALGELARYKPKLTISMIDQLITCYFQLVQSQTHDICEVAQLYDFIVSMIAKVPSLIKNNQRIERMIIGAIQLLARVKPQVEESWLTPQEGFSEDEAEDSDTKAAVQMMTHFNDLSTSIGFSNMREKFKTIAINYLNRLENWRFQYSIIVLASQLGEDCSDLSELDFYVQMALNYSRSPHPKVIYAICELFGQFSTDARPHFQGRYFDKLFQVILQTTKSPHARVVSHALSSLSNFLENFKQKWLVQPYLPQIIQLIKYYLKNGISLVKQASLCVLGVLASLRNVFNFSIGQIFQILNDVITNHEHSDVYQQIVNESFQDMALLFGYQERSLTDPYLTGFLNLLFQYKTKIQKVYYLACWNQVIENAQGVIDLGIYFRQILEFANQIINEEGDHDGLTAIQAIGSTVKAFGKNFQTFVPMTTLFLKDQIQKETLEEKTRESSIEALTLIVEKGQKNIEWRQNSIDILGFLMRMVFEYASDGEGDSLFLEEKLLQGVSRIIKSLGGLDESTIEQLIKKLHEVTSIFQKKYIQRCEDMEISFDEDDEQEEEIQQFNIIGENNEEEIRMLSDGFLGISEVYQAILSISTPDLKQQLIEFIIPQIISNLEKKEDMLKFSLDLIATLLETCSYQELSGHWNNLTSIIHEHALSEYLPVRIGAIYSIGLLATKSSANILNKQAINNWLTILWKTTNIPLKQTEQKNQFLYQTDNIYSSLGKILRYQSANFNDLLGQSVFRKWLDFLPLKYDKKQSEQQQAYLIQILSTHPEIFIRGADDLVRICEIYAEFVYYCQQNHQMIQKTKQSMGYINEWPLFTQSANYLLERLSTRNRNILGRLMSN